MLSAAFSKRGTGRRAGWYGGRVCTIEVQIYGNAQWKHKLEHIVKDVKLDNLKFHVLDIL